MTINDQIRDEELQYEYLISNILIFNYSMNILLVKIYYHLINNK